MSDNIKVVVKVRPLISREIDEKQSYRWRVKNNTLNQLDQNGRETDVCFTFDKVYDHDTKTEEVYNDIAKPIVEAAIDGFNGTIFAYGQTSSGKTYTMTGTEGSPGIISLSVLNLFKKIRTVPNRDFLVRVSYIEIYNETVKDLLNMEKEKIKVHESVQGGVKVDCEEKVTSSPEEVFEVMKKGEANRQTGATNMNEESSRSHSIFQITIESREHIEGEDEVSGCVNVSQLNLVDLAGSERAGQTGTTGIRFKEGTHINKSLSTLALVIKQLSEDPNKFANYRDSKLTRILQNSLGGNAKTAIVCAITPASVEETISTLQFANRAKAIKNKPLVNLVVGTDATMIQSLTKQMSKLQAELAAKRNLEVMLESRKTYEQELQRKIMALQNMILNGFGQHSSIEFATAGHRKPAAPPRRMTISTLHHTAEDSAPPIPQFCTPTLKYNPMCLPGFTEFGPVQSSGCGKLPTVPEEARMTTPPPQHKKPIGFGDEIIEIDSDDDVPETLCSPYHKCYSTSKTPPCVLRRNAEEAERNLQQIAEFTEREKIYTPSVAELMVKLEQNNKLIAHLQEKIDTLEENGKEKDLKIEDLTNKINKTEDEVKAIISAKARLEGKFKEKEILLTDLEVCYDTLKKQAKNREQELLNFLAEQRQCSTNGNDTSKSVKPSEKDSLNFLDMSKDISLVNSDIETSMIHATEDGFSTSTRIQELVSNIRTELVAKNRTIADLEANIFTQQQKIEALESSSQQLQETVNDFKSMLGSVETENIFLKGTIETLNTTVENQKQSLESANKDIQSYNSTIQELLIKLTNKEDILNCKFSDTLIESLIETEQKFIANNENLKNIIHFFRMTLDNKNKELNSLKGLSVSNAFLKEQIETKEAQMSNLIEETEKLSNQLNENMTVINKLLQVEKDLSSQLSSLQEQNEKLQILNANNAVLIEDYNLYKSEFENEIKSLKMRNLQLIRSIEDKETYAKSMLSQNNDQSKKITDMSQTISNFEKKLLESQLNSEHFTTIVNEKEALLEKTSMQIDSLTEQNHIMEKNVAEKQIIIDNLTLHLAEREENEEKLRFKNSEFALQIEHLNERIIILKQELSEKANIIERNEENKILAVKAKTLLLKLRNILIKLNGNSEEDLVTSDDLESILENFDNKLNSLDNSVGIIIQVGEDLQVQMKTLADAHGVELRVLHSEIEKLSQRISLQSKEVKQFIMKSEEDLKKGCVELDCTNKKCVELEIKLNDAEKFNKSLQNELMLKNEENFSLRLDIDALQIKNIDIDTNFQTSNEKYENLAQKKHIQLALNEEISNIDFINRNEILKKIYTICQQCGIEHDNTDAVYKNAALALDTISMHIDLLKTENDIDRNDIEEMLREARNEIVNLNAHHLKLMSAYEDVTTQNLQLSQELQEIKRINQKLFETSTVLRELNIELQSKKHEIKIMEDKAAMWKEQFFKYEDTVKHEIMELVAANKKLQSMVTSRTSRSSRSDSPSKSAHSTENLKINAPQSLLSICCNKLIDLIQPSYSENTSLMTTSSQSSITIRNFQTQTDPIECNCSRLSVELNRKTEENLKLIENLSQMSQQNVEFTNLLHNLQASNQFLLEEREKVRQEIQMLIEPASELKKKIANHKTNLSTLTATTYAENKLLNSQLKVLNHHHTRYVHVCQRVLPTVKNQLKQLMTLLKECNCNVKQNTSLKRFSLPDILDTNTTMNTSHKHESTLDGDLLMLDTNITLTTVNNTLVGPDQTFLEITQNFENEASCSANDTNNLVDPCLVYSQMETLTKDNKKLVEQIDALMVENFKLKENFNSTDKNQNKCRDVQTSPFKTTETYECISTTRDEENICHFCNKVTKELRALEVKFSEEINILSNKMHKTREEKDEIELKLKNTEKENNSRYLELKKITNDLNEKNKILKELQEENNTLSTQIMDNILEVDELKKELDVLKDANKKLIENSNKVQDDYKTNTNNSENCTHCILKTEFIQIVPNNQIDQSKLNRSFSHLESSSRHSKICTLQNELHASKEDCKRITEEVVTIKNHLERSNLSMSTAMDLDESVRDASIFTGMEEPNTTGATLATYNVDNYAKDRHDCLQFYMENIGTEKKNVVTDMKIIDLMKMLYNNLVVKHGNEIENLLNELRDFEDRKRGQRTQLAEVKSKNVVVSQELKTSSKEIISLDNTLTKIRQHVNVLNHEMHNLMDAEKNTVIVKYFKENLLQLIDSKFGLHCVNIFEKIIDSVVEKHQNDLSAIMEQYTSLQNQMENVVKEFNTVNENLKQIKCQLSIKENEYDLLKAQKERIHEISNAVTLDIVKKEEVLTETLVKGYEKLVEQGLVTTFNTDVTFPMNEKINFLFDLIVKANQTELDMRREKQELITELHDLKILLTEKEQAAFFMHEDVLEEEKQFTESEVNKLKPILEEKENNEEILMNKISEVDGNLIKETLLHKNLVNLYESDIKENNVHAQKLLEEIATLKAKADIREELYKEIELLKENILEKETIIARLENQSTLQKDQIHKPTLEQCSLCLELLENVESCKKEIESLKSVNYVIIKEKETYALELDNANEIICKNKLELEKMTSDILVLRESVNENVSIIETLTKDAKTLMEQNVQLKKQFEQRNEECSRLEVNIKTHEKTAQIQSKMITRLQKQKEESDKDSAEKGRRVDELTEICAALKKECEELKSHLETAKKDIEILKNKKESLEGKIVELETEWQEGPRRRQSIEVGHEGVRRRRQSLHDSKRAIDDIEAVFEARASPDDLFERAGSASSSPFPRARDSMLRAGDEVGGVSQARRRRQSLHDQRRGASSPAAPSPTAAEAELRAQLAAAHCELDELRERYRELDEECETCAQYLRERDDQCLRLRKNNTALELRIADLTLRLGAGAEAKPAQAVAHAAVNTDEDWANLHSVVVDRMSFDAEVEKNKKLSRTIEELRCNKQELKATVAKMQRALERGAARETRELEAELADSRRQLAELQARYRELDDECETCAQYLRERDDQLRRLREEKQALEAKLQEVLGGSSASAGASGAARRRRQSAHDHNRSPAAAAPAPPADAHTQVTDDFLHRQVERDDSTAAIENQAQAELSRLKMTLEKVLREKVSLENQLMAVMPVQMPAAFNPTMYVATGSAIVQNQQITDIMRENHKLKKLNAKLVNICKKRGKSQDSNQENEDPADLG